MKVLVVVDQREVNAGVAREIGMLAGNTWADICILGVLSGTWAQDDDSGAEIAKLQNNLLYYRQVIIESYPAGQCPYGDGSVTIWKKSKDGYLEAIPEESPMVRRKPLRLVLTTEDARLKPLHYCSCEEIDLLVVVGDSPHASGMISLAIEAPCSVFVMRQQIKPEQVVCCLDHDQISHYSLEMINQLVVHYKAELKIVGFSDGKQSRIRIESKLRQLLTYYNNLNLTPWLEVVEGSIMAAFISEESKRNLIALWAEPHSFLARLFPKDEVASFIDHSFSSVLLLR